ncbi:MAG: Bacterial regulatory protein tetR family [Solirubrobacterales bacterium]|nr:Bacterial regulatory protein tetR family [Solirubrobacterales bacterium]
MFSERGWETSIEEVARRAQVGLGTVYRRFENKTALVDELARRLLEDGPPPAGPPRVRPAANGPRARRRQDARNSAGRSGGASASALRTPSAS